MKFSLSVLCLMFILAGCGIADVLALEYIHWQTKGLIPEQRESDTFLVERRVGLQFSGGTSPEPISRGVYSFLAETDDGYCGYRLLENGDFGYVGTLAPIECAVLIRMAMEEFE